MVQMISNTKLTKICAEDFILRADTLVCEIATKELMSHGVVLPGYYLGLKVIDAREEAKEFIGRFVIITGEAKVFPAEFNESHAPIKFLVSANEVFDCQLEKKFEKNKIIS